MLIKMGNSANRTKHTELLSDYLSTDVRARGYDEVCGHFSDYGANRSVYWTHIKIIFNALNVILVISFET